MWFVRLFCVIIASKKPMLWTTEITVFGFLLARLLLCTRLTVIFFHTFGLLTITYSHELYNKAVRTVFFFIIHFVFKKFLNNYIIEPTISTTD